MKAKRVPKVSVQEFASNCQSLANRLPPRGSVLVGSRTHRHGYSAKTFRAYVIQQSDSDPFAE
jgi:hypothetical protein